MTKNVPDWLLERYLLGELPPERMAEVRQALKDDPNASARIDAIEASNREVLDAMPPRVFAAAVDQRVRVQRSPNRVPLWAWAGPGLVAAAALIVGLQVVDPTVTGAPDTVETEVVRPKGLDPYLGVHRQSGADVETLSNGAVASPGDVLQLSYVAAGYAYGVVISVDGNGVVTRHLPERGPGAARLTGDGMVHLEHAYELDAAPNFERFFFVTADAPFPVSEVVDAAERVGDGDALHLRDGLQQSVFTVVKGAQR